MMLASCALSGSKVPVPAIRPVPPLSAEDKAACVDPGVRDHAVAQAEIGRQRLAFAECTRKHGRVVNQYQDIERLSAQ